nr:hypothetical protein [Tanacetum cinerariifolium]
MLLETDYTRDDSNFYGCAGLRLAFDPTKSPYYKVVHAGRNSCEIVIQIYSSEFGKVFESLGCLVLFGRDTIGSRKFTVYEMRIGCFVLSNPRINSRKYTIENSFTFGSTEEADKVKILQSCNGRKTSLTMP